MSEKLYASGIIDALQQSGNAENEQGQRIIAACEAVIQEDADALEQVEALLANPVWPTHHVMKIPDGVPDEDKHPEWLSNIAASDALNVIRSKLKG
jgi:hypothetical protein